MAGQWNVSCLSAGLPGGMQINETTTLIGGAVVGEVLSLTLSSGDNTIAVPPGAISVQIIPPAINTQTLKVRTNANSGDAGLPIAAGDQWGPHSFRGVTPAVTSIILNAGGTIAGVQVTFL